MSISLQSCHCGWSKVTSYHGLRIHQGMKGCTPKGMSIPQSEQFSYLPRWTYLDAPINLQEPVIDIFSTPVKPDAQDSLSEVSLLGLRIHQGEMGGTPMGTRIPEQYLWRNQGEEAHQDDSRLLTSAAVKEEPVLTPPLQSIPTHMNPAAKENKMEPNKSLVENQQHSLQMGTNLDKTHPTLDSTTSAQAVWMPPLQSIPTQVNPAAKETKTEPNKSLVENQQHSLQMGANFDKTHPTLDFTSRAPSVLMPASQTQINPAATKTPMKETSKSFFETPQRSHQTTSSSSNKARRGLDFSTGAQQVEKLWEVPTSTAQETAIQSKQKEREQEKEKEAQKLQKTRQDWMRADLQQKIHTRERKLADVTSSVTAYKGSLDAEWLEINSVFTQVMKVVEDARQKALQPLEQRRKEAKREAQDLIQKLQREIDMLKKNIDELDTKPDLQYASGDPFTRGPIGYTWELSGTMTEFCPRLDIPAELHRRNRGCYKPSVPSIIMGNVRSLRNKMEELTALTRLQWKYRKCSLMMFTETWLNERTPDWLVTLNRFHLVRANRGQIGDKKRGGGLVMYVNERWCNAGHVSVEETRSTKDVELLAVSLRPYYLPREFSHIIAITVYIPPSANAAAARELIHGEVSKLKTSHPQSLIIISGDFNHTSLSAALPTFSQYVDCPTRGNDTLDLLYANTKDAYRSSPLPPLGRSDHNLVSLQPIYIPMVKKQPPTIRYVKNWSEETTEVLQDCFETTDWDVLCRPHCEDISNTILCITDYINFCVELKALLKEKRRVFVSGDKQELRRVQEELEKKIKEGKASNKTKTSLQQNNTREV